MPTNVNDKISKLSPDQRRRVEARAAQLIAEEMTLRELRHARKLTQVRMAKTLVSRAGRPATTVPLMSGRKPAGPEPASVTPTATLTGTILLLVGQRTFEVAAQVTPAAPDRSGWSRHHHHPWLPDTPDHSHGLIRKFQIWVCA